MIRMSESLVVAQNVLNMVLYLQDGKVSGWVDVFDNCREQGYKITTTIRGTYRYVAFAQSRNSDDITVFYMEGFIFDLEKCQRKNFLYNEEEKASRFIKQFLHGSRYNSNIIDTEGYSDED